METVLKELQYALRQLRKSPGFSVSAVLMLALGIGAAVATFSIVEGILLRPLPFPDPSRLVALSDTLERVEVGPGRPVSPPQKYPFISAIQTPSSIWVATIPTLMNSPVPTNHLQSTVCWTIPTRLGAGSSTPASAANLAGTGSAVSRNPILE
jgi:hypothetical protein